MTTVTTAYDLGKYGFHFSNAFVNRLTFRLFGFIPIPVTTSGRCGGMAFASLDYYHAGFPAPVHRGEADFPNNAKVPPDGSFLSNYIYLRLMDSFRLNALRFVMLTQLSDAELADATKKDIPHLLHALEDGPVALGLINGRYTWNISNNHQVVAYGAELNDATGDLVIHIYDNNAPDRLVTLTYEPSRRTYRSSLAREDGSAIRYRGWFVEQYTPVQPAYIDLAITRGPIPSNSSPALGDPLDCTYTIHNFGQYPSSTAHLGLQGKDPQGVVWQGCFPVDTGRPYLHPGTQHTYSGRCVFFGSTPGAYLLEPYCWPGFGSIFTGIPFADTSAAKPTFRPSRPASVQVQGFSSAITAPPPYLERLQIVEVTDGFFGPITNCDRARVVYEGAWTYNDASGRRDLQLSSQTCIPMPHKSLIFKLSFASPGNMVPESVRLRLVATTAEGTSIDESVPLTGSGRLFQGTWKPHLTSQSPCAVRLWVEARDDFLRIPDRRPHGDVIDSNPGSVARVDTDTPGFPFIDYDPSSDPSHRLQLTPRRDSLPPDALEANDTPLTATCLSLPIPSAASGAWARFPELSLHNSADQDHFLLQWQSLPSDDTCTLEKPITEPLSDYLGLYLTRYPPCLQISTEAGGMCTDLVLYRTAANGPQLVSTLPKESAYLRYNPARTFPGHSLVFAIRNNNFAAQGAFAYSLSAGYMPAATTLSISSSAPAYLPRPDLLRALLDRYFSLIDLPRPGPDLVSKPADPGFPYLPTSLVITSWDKFTSGLEAFLTHPDTLADLEASAPKQAQAVISDALARLRALAPLQGQYPKERAT